MPAFIKICGLTRLADALLATDLGASALGFIFYPPSPRAVNAAMIAEITQALPEDLPKVGVFVNASSEEMLTTAQQAGLSHLQLHGNESPEEVQDLLATIQRQQLNLSVIKALRLKNRADLGLLDLYSGVQILVDAALTRQQETTIWGGSGQQADWQVAREAAQLQPIILAGGLNPENIFQAWKEVGPFGLDLSSGLESAPGIKDSDKMKQLFQLFRQSDKQNQNKQNNDQYAQGAER